MQLGGVERCNQSVDFTKLDADFWIDLFNFLATLQSRAMHHISKAFTTACSKLEKIGHGMVLTSHALFCSFLFHTFGAFLVRNL